MPPTGSPLAFRIAVAVQAFLGQPNGAEISDLIFFDYDFFSQVIGLEFCQNLFFKRGGFVDGITWRDFRNPEFVVEFFGLAFGHFDGCDDRDCFKQFFFGIRQLVKWGNYPHVEFFGHLIACCFSHKHHSAALADDGVFAVAL